MVYNKNEKPNLENVILSAIAESLSNTHTILIAKVTKVNQKTINCKPVINRVVNNKSVELPEFIEVPILNFLGGTSSIQMPIEIGDYCILFVSERCFDYWYNGNDNVSPLEARMHDYSDSIAFVGLKNQAGELDIPKVITMLGDAYQKGNYTHDGDRTHTGNYVITGNYTQKGDMTITGNFELIGDMFVKGNITCTGLISAGSFGGLNGGSMISNVDIKTTKSVYAENDMFISGISFKGHNHHYTWTDDAGESDTDVPNE